MEKKERAKRNLKFFLSAVGLLMVFVLIFDSISTIFVQPEDDRCYSLVSGYYKEQDDSLDAVFIGSSTSYANFNIMMAWENYGMTAFTLATPHQPIYAAEYLYTEAVKTQPNAVYVFNLGTVCEYFEQDQLYGFHAILDYMPFSLNKIRLTKYLLDEADMKYMENSEYFVPMVRYHEKWSDWDGTDFHKELDGVKGAPHYKQYKYQKRNIEKLYKQTAKVAADDAYTAKIEGCLSRLIQQLRANRTKAVFITFPTAGKSMKILQHVNFAEEYVKNAGYPVLDMIDRDLMDSIGLDLTCDYYNDNHPNIHGGAKTTQYIAEYLMENYGFKDKRGDASFKAKKSWEKALAEYKKMMRPYYLDEEFSLRIDHAFPAPKIAAASEEKGRVELSVKCDDSADGYRIYRKQGRDSKWELVADCAADKLTYTDSATPDTEYTYTAIAYRKDGKRTVFSRYKYFGVTLTVEK